MMSALLKLPRLGVTYYSVGCLSLPSDTHRVNRKSFLLGHHNVYVCMYVVFKDAARCEPGSPENAHLSSTLRPRNELRCL